MSIRWGIVGCGDVCEVKSGPALYKTEGSELSIVMRRDGAKAKDYARRHRVARWTTNVQEVIEASDVDVVYVATPPGSHCELALAVAAAGKPCYVEKPMARSAAECQRMVSAFAQKRIPLFVAYYRRALPRFLKVQELLVDGAIGTVHAASHSYQHPAERAAPGGPPQTIGWREEVGQAGGGLFLDLGSHVLDLMDFFFGGLIEVQGHARARARRPAPGVVEDTVVGSFATESGVLGCIRHQYHTAGHSDVFEIVGSEGSLSFSVFGTEPIAWTRGSELKRLETLSPEIVHQPLVKTVLAELAGQGRCPSSGDSALRTSRVIDELLKGYYGGRDGEFWERDDRWPGVL